MDRHEVIVFCPTMEELKDFPRYVPHMEILVLTKSDLQRYWIHSDVVISFNQLCSMIKNRPWLNKLCIVYYI